MAMCITAEAEVALKPFQLANLLRSELELLPDDDDKDSEEAKPKDIVALAWAKLGQDNGALTENVKDNARAARAIVRSLKANFWTDRKARGGTEMKDLLDRLLAKPASAGGFAAGIACTCIGGNNKNIDTKNIHSKGIGAIDGFTVLRGPGAYATLDHDMEVLFKLFRSQADACKIGDTTFRVEQRTQPYKGQDLLTAKATKCEARFVALLTPKWLLVGLYQHVVVDNETNAAIFQLFEDLRLEVIAPKSM
jgi:hypothetical protein